MCARTHDISVLFRAEVLDNLHLLDILNLTLTCRELSVFCAKHSLLHSLCYACVSNIDCKNLDGMKRWPLASLPPSLKTFDCSGCSRMTTIPRLPETLLVLNCEYCEKLGNLKNLRIPKSLSTLNCSGCPHLPSRLAYSTELRELFCSNIQSLTLFTEGSLPPGSLQNLRKLECNSCINLIVMPKTLPPSLQELYCRWCQSLRYLPERLPPNLRILDCSYSYNLSSLWSDSCPAPPELHTLLCKNCRYLNVLPDNIHHTMLHTIDVSWTNIVQIPPCIKYCTHLRTLDCGFCKYIYKLPADLPEGLLSLNCEFTPIQELPETLPSSLCMLKCHGCEIPRLPERLPPSLLKLFCGMNKSMTRLCILPPTLKVLNCGGCVHLKTLPAQLPPSLVSLRVDDCYQLTALPDVIPPEVQVLSCVDCQTLTSLPDSLEQCAHLQLLDCTRCKNILYLPSKLPSSLLILRYQECDSLFRNIHIVSMKQKRMCIS